MYFQVLSLFEKKLTISVVIINCNHQLISCSPFKLLFTSTKFGALSDLILRRNPRQEMRSRKGKSAAPKSRLLELFTCCMETCRLIFYKTWKIPGPCTKTFCRTTLQPLLFELKLKTFPLLQRCDHFFSRVSFSSKYLM